MKRRNIENGSKFGKMTVLQDLGIFQKEGVSRKHHYYLCKCDCGRNKEVIGSALTCGNTTTCGNCSGVSIKYGSSIMTRYQDMMSRCFNKNSCNYKHYGNRGIKVCDEWANQLTGFDSFANWALSQGFKSELMLDRIDNDGDYSPSNCRWVIKRMSNINRRNLKNTSGFIGVRRHSSGKGWYGSLKINNKDYYTGFSDDLMTAVKMRNDYIKLHRLDNQLNQIDGG